ncbi:MAG TPA: DUF6573 family protein [Isosphaeraceae bacterium]|nr:DUF6573 family protein [Isosphaeraceae bacterium]
MTAPEPEALNLADFDLISVCTRARAIADGVLIDVTETARDAGLRWPTALTAAAYERHMKKIPERGVAQDEARRLRDVLRMCRFGLGRAVPGSTEVLFQLHVRTDNRDALPPLDAGWEQVEFTVDTPNGSTPGNRGHAVASWNRFGGRPRRLGGAQGGSGIGWLSHSRIVQQ